MKKSLLSLIALFSAGMLNAQVPTNGRILHLDFEWNSTYGSFYDASGINNTMPLITGAVSQASGYAGQSSTAISFNGSSYITYTSGLNNIPQGNDPYTIAMMVKAQNSNPQLAGLMGYGAASNGNCNSIRLSGNAMVMNYWYGGVNYDFNGVASSQIIGNWTHIAVTYDGTDRKMYINGSLVGTMATIGAPTYSNSAFYIGRTIDGSENLSGIMDEFIMYNRALSSTEIAQVSNHAFCLTTMSVTPVFGPAINIALNGFTNPTIVTAITGTNTLTYTVSTGTVLTIPNLQAATAYTVSAASSSGCIAVKTVTTSAGCADYAPSNGLLLHLPFSGNITDMSSTGAIPSVNTGTLSNDKCGNANSAYYLAAGNYLKYDLTQYPALKAGTNGKTTVLCWAKPISAGSMANYASMIEIGESVFLRKTNGAAYFETGGYNANNVAGSGGYFGMTPSWTAFDDWHMYAFTYDATGGASQGKTSAWLDTLEYAESNPTKLSAFYNQPISYTVSSTNTSLWIGGGSIASKKFNGWIDNVCIYDRVLSKAEIKDIYFGNATGIATSNMSYITKKGLKLYPNPAHELLNIESREEMLHINVMDMMGKTVFEIKSIHSNQVQLNLNDIPAGVYLIQINGSGGEIITQKLIRE